MRPEWWKILVAVMMLALLGTACDDGESKAEEDEFVVVVPGKADNFFSQSAQEYTVTGEYYVEVESWLEGEEAEARAYELINLKQIAVNWFLLQYLTGPEDDHNIKYKSLTKNGSYEDLEVRQDEEDTNKYWFKFQQEIGGQMDLIDELPTTIGDDGLHRFTLPVGVVRNSTLEDLELNSEWYRSSPWSGFDPLKVNPDQVEYIDLTIQAQPRSNDAFIDYAQLYADGVVTMGIHFGWDYHNDYHIVHSKDIYNYLVNNLGFDSPVDSYDDYTRTSGPLTRTIDANGKEVRFEISLYWGQPGTDTDPDTDAGGRTLEDDMRKSFSEREVIVFSGHSGPFYGYALANWRKTDEGDLDDSEVAGLNMPSSYQVVLSEGCETYALGEAFWSNPAKEGEKNLDIITTTNFSNASTAGVVRNFIRAIIGDDYGKHSPWTYGDLLEKLDDNSSWFQSMYGVHGIDDNPTLHPYAVVENFCGSCERDSDCGPAGNRCVTLGDERVCTAECLNDDSCPAGYDCVDIARSAWIEEKACIPANYTCEAPVPSEPEVAVIINELLADPPADLAGDANGDGWRDSYEDEFIELLNISDATVDLSGYQISDKAAVRVTFPEGTTLAAGQMMVVWGGGYPVIVEGTRTYLSVMGLGLNNAGDHIFLTRPDGSIENEVSYGSEGGHDRSLVRVSADPAAEMVQHPGDQPFSPGL